MDFVLHEMFPFYRNNKAKAALMPSFAIKYSRKEEEELGQSIQTIWYAHAKLRLIKGRILEYGTTNLLCQLSAPSMMKSFGPALHFSVLAEILAVYIFIYFCT